MNFEIADNCEVSKKRENVRKETVDTTRFRRLGDVFKGQTVKISDFQHGRPGCIGGGIV